MTLTANVVFRSDGTKHIAWNTGKRWQVSWMPERVFTQDQAEAAMNIAELVGTGYASPEEGITSLPGWAAELGVTPLEVFQHVADRRAWGCAVRYAHLPWQHKALLLLLGTYFDTDGVYHRPTIADLATVTGLAEQHIVDLLIDLEHDHWFSWHAVTGAETNTPQPERPLVLDPVLIGATAGPVAKADVDGDAV